MSRPSLAQKRTQESVQQESVEFAGTCGESATATQSRFHPAFRNEADGRVEVARMPNGQPAAMHLISALPESWAAKLDDDGHVVELIEGIVAGFVRDGRFYTREEAAAAT
jgi:hypothetical protein